MSMPFLVHCAQLQFRICTCEEPEEDEDHRQLHLQPEREWRFNEGSHVFLELSGSLSGGQSAIYGERFIMARLAEEAAVVKQDGSG